MKSAMIVGTIMMVIVMFIQSIYLSICYDDRNAFIRASLLLLINICLVILFVYMYKVL